jgi:hypothetical protein
MFSDSVTSKGYTIKFRNTQDWRIQRHSTNTQPVSGFATIPKRKPAHKMCSVYCEALDLHTTLMNPSGWRSASSHHHRRRQRRDGHVCVWGGGTQEGILYSLNTKYEPEITNRWHTFSIAQTEFQWRQRIEPRIFILDLTFSFHTAVIIRVLDVISCTLVSEESAACIFWEKWTATLY